MLHSITFGTHLVSSWNPYQTGTAYAVGDQVRHKGRIWEFTASHAAGAWIGTDAKDVTTDEGIHNTFDDWGLIPVKHPVFTPPAVKIKTMDLPARNGLLDLTEAIRGYPLYNNREGSFQFLAPTDNLRFQATVSEIGAYLHGQESFAVLEDDPDYFYVGRFEINELECDRLHGLIMIEYSVEPYRWAVKRSVAAWEWDPFSFVDGVIMMARFANLEIGTTDVKLDYSKQETGAAPVKPVLTCYTKDVTLTIKDKIGTTLDTVSMTKNTDYTIAGLVLYNGMWLYNGQAAEVYAKTAEDTAELWINFRLGRL